MLLLLALTGSCLLVALAAEEAPPAAQKRGPDQLLRVWPGSQSPLPETEQLSRLLSTHPDLDVWRLPSRGQRSLDIRVEPEDLVDVQRTIADLTLESRVMIPDLQRLITEQGRQRNVAQRASVHFGWDNYYQLYELNEWLSSIKKKHPNVCSCITAGKSVEGRTIKGVKLHFGSGKPVAFVEGGIHAREWISPATATFLIDEILHNKNPSWRKIVESFEWHIFPVVNPDGYVYSFTKERLWRKNRSNTKGCWGVDLNRNWGFNWQASDNCTETYPGLYPASEPETHGLRKYLHSLKPRCKLYISLHSYSQLLMIPWSSTTEHVPHHARLKEIAKKAVEAIRRSSGTEFEYGTTADILYIARGTSTDYAYSTGIRHCFTFELRDQGDFGFLLPPSEIMGSAQEAVEAIGVIAKETFRDVAQ